MGHGGLPVKTKKPRYLGAFGVTQAALLFMTDAGCDSFISFFAGFFDF